MTTFQKVIKYLAIAFAVFLIVSIISGICYGLQSVSFLFVNMDSEERIQEFTQSEAENALYIGLSGAELVIKNGDAFKADFNGEYISCRQDGNKILITQKKTELFGKNKACTVTVYVPEAMMFDEADIEVGAGQVTIDELNTKELSLDMGAGETVIGKLNVTGKAEIDSGMGAFTVKNGSIANLSADTGIGEFNLASQLTGSSEINHGIGEANIRLIGDESDYTVNLDKGLGEATLNGQIVGGGSCGNGANYVEADCGIGAVHIDFFEEN